MKPRFLLTLAVLFSASSIIASDIIPLRLENRSTEKVALLRGNNPGKGNEDGTLAPGQSRTVNSVRGRIWSFMVDGKLVEHYRTTGSQDQVFSFTNEMLRSAFPGTGRGKKTAAPATSNSQSRGVDMIGDETGSRLSVEEATQYVNLHNTARAKVGVNPVKWSQELAEWAQKQATGMARSGEIGHTPNSPYGENLAFGSGPYSAIMAVRDWNSEEQFFKRGEAARISGNRVTGHYTQMVWNQTREVGAGIATIQKGAYKGWTIVVGVYDPPGNMNGRPPY